VKLSVSMTGGALLVLTASGCAGGERPVATRPDAAVTVDIECRGQPGSAMESCKVVRDTAPECGYAARALARGKLAQTDGTPPPTVRNGPYLNDPLELRGGPTVSFSLTFPACRPVPLDPGVPTG